MKTSKNICSPTTAFALHAALFMSWAFLAATPMPSLPRVYSMDQVRQFNPEAWGPVVTEHGTTYRSALGGRPAWFRIPGWWGDTIRPPFGAHYILEVTYRDVIPEPAIAEVFGAVEVNLGRSETHRFGGRNDGKWKVANIPASWDTLIWPRGTKSAEFAFRTSTDIPISAIRIREASLPEDQIRYEKESREWVAQVQAPRIASAKARVPAEVPAIPKDLKEVAFVPYVRPYYHHIFPNSAPQKGEVEMPIRIRIARNEYEPATFAVYAQRDIDHLNYSLSDLRNASGEKLACEIRRFTVEFALEQNRPSGSKSATLVWVPQRLWPTFDTEVRKGQSAWFYLTMHTLGSLTKPGIYSGRILISDGTNTGSIPLEVEVLPISLLTMEESGLRMGGCTKGLPTAGELQVMQEHNHNMINLWFHGVRPEMKKVGNRIELDFYYLDNWMAMARERGQKSIVWFLGGNPNGYPETLSIEAELYSQMYEGGKAAFYRKSALPENRGKILPELRELYRQWLVDVTAHARDNNWPELIFTPFDEPAKWAFKEPKIEANRKFAIGCGPWIRDHFKAACALIHEAVPGNRVYLSLHNNYESEAHGYKGRIGEIFLPDVDIVCTNAIEEDNQLADKVRRAGKEFWQYTGLQTPRFSFGFWFGAWDSRGSLCWAYNWGARFDITSGSNWQYAWHSPFDTILTPAYEEMREAWDDRRYLETAKATAKKAGKDITFLLRDLQVAAFGNQGGNNSWKEGADLTQMDRWRRQLADLILSLDAP
jgi:hypothetical protein